MIQIQHKHRYHNSGLAFPPTLHGHELVSENVGSLKWYKGCTYYDRREMPSAFIINCNIFTGFAWLIIQLVHHQRERAIRTAP